MSKAFLSVEGLTQKFPSPETGELTVFENINFKVEKGEFITIIGHSGCGKSTILNVLAGLDEATSGAVIMEGKEVSGPSLDRGVVFQNYSLLPWLSTLSNVTFAVESRHPDWSKEQVKDHAMKYLELVGLSGGVEQRKPSQLSGGMRQRVSIARAFATQPKLLLLDEPFGALDALTRAHLQDSLMEIQQQLGNTVIMITHDVDEAVLLSDRIVMMTNGPAASIGEVLPIDLPRPRNRVVLADDPDFNNYRQQVLRFLYEKQKNPTAKAA